MGFYFTFPREGEMSSRGQQTYRVLPRRILWQRGNRSDVGLSQLMIEHESALASKVVLARLGRPIERTLAAWCPILRDRVRSRQLEAGVVAVT